MNFLENVSMKLNIASETSLLVIRFFQKKNDKSYKNFLPEKWRFFFIKFAKTQGEISDLKRKNFKAQGKNSPENRSKKIGLNYVIVSNQARDTW